MQFSTLLITFMATAVIANPVKRNEDCGTCGGGGGGSGSGSGGSGSGSGSGSGGGTPAPYDACTSTLYSSAECCATDVLGVADLDCATVPKAPTSGSDFSATCAALGQRARCCVLPVLGQGVLCDTPIGVSP
ncbi:Cerato-ulmin hydrophobin family [Whalleya microplaca]|nr:Cerato-ulmin hydrophobin family [Whalleya microplaca]